jgi:uncharacterized protein (TIGR02594 family)
MTLPAQYNFLETEGAPRMIVEALKLYGIEEKQGGADNPIILEWAKECGLKDYTHDSIPWCGLAMAVVAFRGGKEVPASPLWAANWLNFGTKVSTAMLGDILVFIRPGGNHVALYVGEDETAYHCLGGNQGDKFSIIRVPKTRLKGIRKPIYKTGQPANVRQIFLKSNGEVSHNEK